MPVVFLTAAEAIDQVATMRPQIKLEAYTFRWKVAPRKLGRECVHVSRREEDPACIEVSFHAGSISRVSASVKP